LLAPQAIQRAARERAQERRRCAMRYGKREGACWCRRASAEGVMQRGASAKRKSVRRGRYRRQAEEEEEETSRGGCVVEGEVAVRHVRCVK